MFLNGECWAWDHIVSPSVPWRDECSLLRGKWTLPRTYSHVSSNYGYLRSHPMILCIFQQTSLCWEFRLEILPSWYGWWFTPNCYQVPGYFQHWNNNSHKICEKMQMNYIRNAWNLWSLLTAPFDSLLVANVLKIKQINFSRKFLAIVTTDFRFD